MCIVQKFMDILNILTKQFELFVNYDTFFEVYMYCLYNKCVNTM